MNNPRIDFVKNNGTWIICAFIILSIAAVYWQVSNHEFIAFDDGLYVTENVHIKRVSPPKVSSGHSALTTKKGFIGTLLYGAPIL
jgi:hypothetical protein